MTLYEITDDILKLLTYAEDPDVDDQAFRDTMEALTLELEDKADGYAKAIRTLKGEVEAIKAEIDRLTKRKTAIENHIAAMNDNLEQSMIATGKEKFKTDLFSFNIQNNPVSVVIDDPDNIPDEFYKIEMKVSKAFIKEAIETGQDVPFAHLEQTRSLRIR